MTFSKRFATVSAALLSLFGPVVAQAADKVVIGDIDDMSGLYADVNGPRAVEGSARSRLGQRPARLPSTTMI